MNVGELIAVLQKIDDQSLPVAVEMWGTAGHGRVRATPNGVSVVSALDIEREDTYTVVVIR